MRNNLDDIYADYKRNGKDERHTTHGVPSPIIDSEFEQNSTDVRVCPECGSMNISFDVSTNKTTCNESDCHKESDKPHRIDFQKKMAKETKEEFKNVEEALKRGDTFGQI